MIVSSNPAFFNAGSPAGSRGPYVPISTNDLRIWLDASFNSTRVVNNNFVNAWKFSKPTSGQASSTGISIPITNTNLINGKSVVTWDDIGDDALVVLPTSNEADLFANGGTAFFALRAASKGGGAGQTGYIYSKTQHSFFLSNTDAESAALSFTQEFSTSDGSWQTAENNIEFTETAIITLQYNSSVVTNVPTIRINGFTQGVNFVSSPSGTAVSDVTSSLHLGNSSQRNQGFHGDFAEVIWYKRSLSLSEISDHEQYLSDKWE